MGYLRGVDDTAIRDGLGADQALMGIKKEPRQPATGLSSKIGARVGARYGIAAGWRSRRVSRLLAEVVVMWDLAFARPAKPSYKFVAYFKDQRR
jgi:hypothetical protein